MFGGNQDIDPSQMQQMMQQFGIDMDQLDAETITVELADGGELVFENDVDLMEVDAGGDVMYQVMGTPDTDTRNSNDDVETEEDGSENEGILQEDIELVADQANVTEEEAEEALREHDGQLTDAVRSLD